MASIAEWIEKIKTAIYGEEVRGAIWQSLEAMNTEVEAINVDEEQIQTNKTNIATNTAAITALNSRTKAYSYDKATGNFLDWVRTTFTSNGEYYVIYATNNSDGWISSSIGSCLVQRRNNDYFLTAYINDTNVAANQTIYVNRYVANAWLGWSKLPAREEFNALKSSINFGVNTSVASTEKAVYIKAIADAVAEAVGITTNKSILGYVFVSGIDTFSCMGAIRGRTIRMIVVASNAATYSVVRDGNGAVTYKEIAMVS